MDSSQDFIAKKILLCAKACYNGLKLRIYFGDILKVKADCVVNPANQLLTNSGGLAGQIADQAGERFVRECQELIRRYNFNKYSCAVTSAGNLRNCKKIIHVIGPIVSGSLNEYQKSELEEAVLKSLEKAEQEKLESISIPAISCGIYGFPIEQGADIHIKTFIKFAPKKGKLAYLKTVNFVMIEEKEVDQFLYFFMKYIDAFNYSKYIGLLRTQESVTEKYCNVCSQLYPTQYFSIAKCHRTMCNFCICRYKNNSCMKCGSVFSSDEFDFFNCVLCRICKIPRPKDEKCCQQCNNICQAHYRPGGKCDYCSYSY